jgi:hypothetical protein
MEERNIDSQFSEPNRGVTISETGRMLLGKQILLFLGLFVTGVCGFYFYQPDNSAVQAVFELIKIGALPLVTLIITFYFPTNQK